MFGLTQIADNPAEQWILRGSRPIVVIDRPAKSLFLGDVQVDLAGASFALVVRTITVSGLVHYTPPPHAMHQLSNSKKAHMRHMSGDFY